MDLFGFINSLSASVVAAIIAVALVVAVVFILVVATKTRLNLASMLMAALGAGLMYWVVANFVDVGKLIDATLAGLGVG